MAQGGRDLKVMAVEMDDRRRAVEVGTQLLWDVLARRAGELAEMVDEGMGQEPPDQGDRRIHGSC